MPSEADSLYYLSRDIQCSINPDRFLLILKCSHNALQNIPTEKLLQWLEKINKWAKFFFITPECNIVEIAARLVAQTRQAE